MNSTNAELFPITEYTIITTILFCIGSFLSVIGGIGGGGFYVSLLTWLLNFQVTLAVPISNCVIFISSAISIIFRLGYYYKKHHGLHDFININICLFLAPISFGGTIIGVILNLLLPSVVIICVLITVLLISMGVTFWQVSKVKKIHRAVLDEVLLKSLEESDQIDKPIQYNYINKWFVPKLAIFITFMLIILSCSTGKKYVECGSVIYWFLIFIPVLFSVIIVVVHCIQYRKYQSYEEDFIMKDWQFVLYGLISFVGGILSSLVGIGTGIVICPMLYVMSKKKNTGNLTNISTFIVLSNTFISTIQYIIFDKLSYVYALWFSSFIVIPVIGGFYLSVFFEKKNKKHYVTIIMGIIIGLSGFLLLIQFIIKLNNSMDNSTDVNYNIC
jgi:uncharacterized membrane protein YfcA